MDYDNLTFNPERDYSPVDVLPVEAFDLALQMQTGYTPVETISSNKTFNGGSIADIKGRVCDPFLEADLCRVLHRGSIASPGPDSDESENAENENPQK